MRRRLLRRSDLQAVRLEARRLWVGLTEQTSDSLRQNGADPSQASFRLSEEHPKIWNLITSGILPETVIILTGWPAIRPFHFYLLFKRPSAGMTAWHRDKDALPTSAHTITCWIPLSDVRADSGLIYAEGTTRLSPKAGMTDSDGRDLIERHGAPLVSTGEVRVGDVNFHDGKIWHCGQPNRMSVHRDVIGICYVPTDACFVPDPPGFNGERGKAMRRELQKLYFSHLSEGAVISGASHPVISRQGVKS